jgi:hypothetical protein
MAVVEIQYINSKSQFRRVRMSSQKTDTNKRNVGHNI